MSSAIRASRSLENAPGYSDDAKVLFQRFCCPSLLALTALHFPDSRHHSPLSMPPLTPPRKSLSRGADLSELRGEPTTLVSRKDFPPVIEVQSEANAF
ncbi:hypothetical protein GGX14DRAFT_561123 [Mycena pura]|uniref:Uncharacterized protein n=1 Tax=Mycena pura TaxID=153505 RepID=A0AAD6VRN0_9AGAR|nr:hypothetical protein GGX14DRAFT_561123 [Mycena pura]